MGRLDHVHIRVPDRAQAAAWYSEHLGFEPVDEYEFWATGFDGGPLQISADGGKTMLALFEATETHPMIPQETGVAFSVDAETFIGFARSLPGDINGAHGEPLTANELIEFDLCWAFDLVDPWGNRYELNCYDYQAVRLELVDKDGVVPVRYWPIELFQEYERSKTETTNHA
jgi:catechol 2,3-dioxygenase-like lactoylglutathione lyase family enzyme